MLIIVFLLPVRGLAGLAMPILRRPCRLAIEDKHLPPQYNFHNRQPRVRLFATQRPSRCVRVAPLPQITGNAMLETLPTDIWFYAAAVPAVIITGVSKGGFGGIALLAVPLLSLVVPPVTAAAIMLPLLLMMDALGVIAWRRKAAWDHLAVMLPGAFAGILVGAVTAKMVSADTVRLVVGTIAVSFCLYSWWPKKSTDAVPGRRATAGAFWGAVAGYTSYIAHAGSPPFHTYLLPRKLDKQAFAATGVWFFALVNLAKLPAYIATGQLTRDAFMTALVLAPLVPVGFFLGMWLNKRVPHTVFYRVVYGAVFLTGLKLVHSALASAFQG
jgi:uncharacterized membrane protein YfcA